MKKGFYGYAKKGDATTKGNVTKKTFMLVILAIITIVMTAIYHAQTVERRQTLIATNPELAKAMTYGELTDKDEETQSEHVRFGVYFARDLNGDGYAEKVKGTCKEVEGEDTLYMTLNVLENGYLKDAKIEIEADNMYFKTALVDDEVVEGNYISENTTTINLKQVQAGTQKLIFGQVRSGDYRYTSTKRDAIGKDTNKYSGINKITLTGTHVKNDGTETQIEKEIEVPVDWYGTTKAEIPYTYGSNKEKNKYQNYNTEGIVDEANQEVNLEFKIVTQESNNKLLLKKSSIEGTIPEFNGYKATKIEITGENVEYTYDEETGNFTAYREATTGENGVVTKEAYTSSWGTARYSEYKLKVTYPLAAYENASANGTIVLNIPVKATFEGYNNANEEFNNPYISNTAEDIISITYERGGGDVIGYDVQVGTWVPNPYNVYVVSKENAVSYYNQVPNDTKDTYEVKWYVSRGNSGEISNVQLREQDANYTDKFLKTDGTYEDMLPYSKNIGIYFTTPGAMFGENGWIRVYNDETDELIHEFTSEDWENYTKETPYLYDEPVDHIRIETSEAERVSSFTATSIKEMDNQQLTTDKIREEFDKLSKIYSYLSGYAKYSEEEEYQKLKDDVGIANYDEPLSMAQISSATPTTLSTQETTNMKITIGTVNLGYNVEAWKNGTFLVKFPQEVLLAEINNITINNNNVTILGYDIYEQDGNYYLKILTENENPEHYTITIDANITPDPRKISATRDIELYAYNEECNNYKDTLRAQDIYDINGDGNTEDLVDYSKRSITFVGPTTLLTTETASDYNEEGDEIKTTVAPQIAEIDKTQNNRTAKISVQITNNYSGNISGIVVVGKTPFAGNTSQILGTDLGSTFTAKMTGPIELPEQLQGIAKVYYSENETVNNDLNDSSNNWKTAEEITDFSSIRTYAIDLSDYVIQKSEEYICTYEIEVPQDVNYNDVSYSTHAVYFYLETDEGKLADQTETNKLGFKIARKYNLEINKVKQGTNSPIQGASFSVQAEGEESSRIVASDAQGKINIQDLYVGKVYTVKELKAPSDYVLNGETIKFTTTVDEYGYLQVQELEGNGTLHVEQATEEEPAEVSFTVTNEPKYTFKLTKEDQDGNLVQGVRFNLTGKGLPTAGRTVTTNRNGELTITGLYPNEEYTLTEVYAEGYEYSEAPIKFKTVWNGNNLEAQVIEGSFKEQPTVDNTQEKQPIMSASIVNTKLDEYYLYLDKCEKETPNLLPGAVFRVTGKWLDNEYTTDEHGILVVGPLYEGIEYTIEEIMPPAGYALSDNIVRFVVDRDEEGNPYLQILEGEIKPLSDFETEEGMNTYGAIQYPVIDKDGNEITDKCVSYRAMTVVLALDNEPLFSLTKIDGETQEPLPNVKFAITKVEDDGTETQAVNSKGEVIGERLQIDGKVYQVITTDEQGRITEDLPEGYYKVVEIVTADGYQLPENEEDRTYLFGIGKTKPEVKEMVELWSQSFEGNREITYTDSVATDDGGYIKIGYLKGTVKFDENATANKETLEIKSNGNNWEDGVVIKYNNLNEIVWSSVYGASNNTDYFDSIVKTDQDTYVISGRTSITGLMYTFHIEYDNSGNLVEENTKLRNIQNGSGEKKILQTSDGGFIGIENFNNTVTIPAENTVNNQEIVINTNGNTDGLAIKYNSEHKVEWAKSIGGKQADQFNDFAIDNNGNIIVVGQFTYDANENYIKISAEETVKGEEIVLKNTGSTDFLIIKYTPDGLVDWAEIPGATGNYESFKSIHINNENKYITFGYLGNGGLDITPDKTANGQSINIRGTSCSIQYNAEGKIEWADAYQVGSNAPMYETQSTTDGGSIQLGLVNTTTGVINADQTADGKEIKLTTNGLQDIMVQKMNGENKIEWVGMFGSIVAEGENSVKNVIELPNNRYLIQVYLTAKATIPSDQTTLEEDVELLGRATLIYNSDGLVEYVSSEVSSSSQYNSVVATSDGGQIAVGQMTGKLHVDGEQTTSTGENMNVLSNGNTDMLLAKYSQDGKIDWAISLGGTGADVLNKVIEKDDTYITVGKINGNLHIDKEYTSSGEDIDIISSGDKGILLEINEEGKIITVKVAEGGNSTFTSIQNLDSGDFIIGARAITDFTIDGFQLESLNSNLILIEFNNDISVKNLTNMYISSWSDITNIVSLEDGGIVVVGNYNWNKECTIPSEATTIGEINVPSSQNVDGFIVRLNADRKIEYFKIIQPKDAASEDSLKDVVKTKDGGYLALWQGFEGSGIEFTEEETASGEVIIGEKKGWTSYLIKYNSDNKVEWIKNVTGLARKILPTMDKGYLITSNRGIAKYSSSFDQQYTINPNGIYLEGVENGDNTYTFFGYQTENNINTAKVAKFQENTISAEIPEQQELIIENYKKEHKITTEVEGSGGSISGQGSNDENPYEIVEDGADSTKEIVITPDAGYKILKITVNGEEIDFVPEEDGSVILDKFVNMTSDKHVVVQFSNSVSTVIVHHYKDGTTEKLAEDETLTGEIGTNYTTAPKDIADYEVVIEKLPSNASGQYTEDVQEVIYYYKQTPVKFIVHHYLEGTEEIVPGSEDDQINEERERGSEYTTSPATGIDDKYELVEISGNPSGTLTENETVITYYYRVKDSAGVIVHHIDTDSKQPIAPDVMIPAEGTGKYGDSYTTEVSSEIPANYEYVTRTENWEGTMIDTLTEVTYEYKLVDPNITEQTISKTATESIDNPKAEIEYGITYTTTIENYIGKAQITIVDTLPYKIDVSKSSLNGGTYDENSQTITWTELVDGIDTYTNSESGNIEIHKTIKVVYLNMDVSKETIENNVSGNVKLFTPSKTSEDVTDTATTNTEFKMDIPVSKIWDDENNKANKRPETITFKLTGSDGSEYLKQLINPETEENTTEQDDQNPNKWNAIFEDLPKFDKAGNEITYTLTEEIEDNIFYPMENVDISGDQKSGFVVTNTFEVPGDKIEIPVTKIWDDNENSAQKRPSEVTITLVGDQDPEVAGNDITKEYTLTEDDVQGNTNEWTYTFTELPKYNTLGNEIQYTIDEKDLDNEFYQKTNVDQENRTITNKFVVPTTQITIHLEKQWNDNNNEAQKRPASVTIQIKNGEEVEAEEVLTEDTGWQADVEVPKYDANGNEIQYTVVEKATGNIFYTEDNTSIEGTQESGFVVTNTFEVPNVTIEIPVTKVWNDNNNKAQKRPDKVTIRVEGDSDTKQDGYEVNETYEITTKQANEENPNEWNYTITGLQKYDNLGNEIEYVVTEEDTGSIFYTKENTNIEGSQETGYVVTNTFEVPYVEVSVPVTKVWDDEGNKAGKRPSSITVTLTGSDGTEKTQELTIANADSENTNNWTYTFSGLAKYDENGDEINYEVTEEPTGSIFYTPENTKVEGDMNSGYTITNKFVVPGDKVAVRVNKQWVDTTEQQDKRPASVTVVLMNGNTEVERQDLNEENAWEHTFTELPKYDELGNMINYTIEEVTVNEFYTSSTSGDMNSGYVITNTFRRPEDTVEITVNKVWADNNNEAGRRPSSVTLKVTGNGQTYTYSVSASDAETDANTWTHTFTGLPKYDENGNVIEYIVDEEALTENSEFYLKTVDQEKDTVTNTFKVPGDNVKVRVTKAWQDTEETQGKRPASVTLQLKDGENVILTEEANVENNWTVEFTAPKYDSLGKEIQYIVAEADTGNIFYKAENAEISGDMNTGFTVTNKFVVPGDKVEVSVNKQWVDTAEQQDKRSESVTVALMNGETQVQTKDLNKENGWMATFNDLPKYDSIGNIINYTVQEVTTNKFYTTTITGNMADGYVITNTFKTPDDTTQIMVNKIWKDNDIQAQRRPDSLILVVKNGDEEVKTQEITKENMVEGTTNQWSTIIDGLPKYDGNGDEIQYTVEEREKTEGDLKFYKAEENPVTVEDNQATIRNSFVKPDDTTTVIVSKVWNDNNDANGKRPDSIKLQVKDGENVVKEQVVNVDNDNNGDTNNWTYTFTDLPKYDDNGQEIVYTASEVEVNTDDLKFYTNDGTTGDMTSGYTITNTFTVPDERIELTVNKVWNDNAIQANRRPETIVINVKAENADNNNPEAVIDTYELNTATENSHTFIGLKKYNSQGNEIQYTVEEQEKNPGDLHFYTEVVGTVENTGENSKEVTITNTFEKPDDTTEVTVTKVWDDNSDEAQKRPESINLQLKNGNATVKEQVVNVSNAVSGDTNTWQYTFTGVEKYNDNGQEIVYTVDETEVNHNDLQFYTKKLEGTTVTNTFTQNTDKVEIPIKKVWEDNGIQAQRRPESIIIVLKANGVENQRYELTKENADVSDENIWTYTFTELPKYDQYNNIINYTIEEEEKTQGDLKFYTGKVDGTTITNTFTRPTDTIRIDVNKKWEDQDNVYNKRPTSIRLEVKQGEMVIKSEVVTQDDNWQATFTDLPKYDENGQEIEYTVDEEEVSPDDLFHYEKQIGEVTDKEMLLDEKEATITNTMTKIPSTVVVKYVDKNTGKEITDRKTKEGIVGDPFDVTEDVKDIDGYTLVEEPAEKTGVYTVETQEKIYYYAKNTRVIVKYLEQDDTPEDIADNQVLAPEVTIEGYEGKDYTTVEEEIPEYTLVSTTDNLEGKMQREEIVVIYYYAPNTNVTVKYLERDDTADNSDNKVLAPEEIINGHVGQDYTTQAKDIDGYTLVAATDNREGTMTKDPIEVIYYYAQNTKVIIKYLEKDETPEDNTDNQVLAEEVTIEGYAGLEYETEQKDIENYTFVESTNNTEGKMTNDVIEVIYYYAQNTKATVQHIDRETGEILKEETKEGKVGDLFETQAEDFEGYVLVESPEEPNIIMDKTGEQVVKYYYAHVSAGVIEKHIDDITGELLYSEEHQGNEGDQYSIPSREFDGYDLVTEDKDGNSRLPENAEGEMKRDEVIEVKYYYIKKAKVIVKYLEEDDTPEDTTDNQVLAEEEIIEGHENDSYETTAKEIEDYNLVKTPENATGTMVITKNPDGTYNTEIEVIYYYKKAAGGVIENHIDITTGNILATGTHEGNVGDPYDISSRNFDGYDLVEADSEGNNRLPDNAQGNMTEEKIVVNYYYIKRAKVKVEYIDKITGEKLDEEELPGHVGDSYTTEEKKFDGYELIEKPSNSTGEMTEGEIVVKYYYARKAEVEVKYLEKGTDYEVASSETIDGYVGDKYETSAKDIPYYKFVESTDNTNGTMEKDKITVIYYYEKQVFNIGIDKWVASVNVNGISEGAKTINNKDEMYVVDIHRSKTDTADVRVTYKIRVTNKGEIEGSVGEIIEYIPEGYSYYPEDNSIQWGERNGTFVTNALANEVIQPGQYKEIEIVLRWNRGENNFGEKKNVVAISGEENPAGFADSNKEDNQSTADMMITVATGLDRNGRFILNVVLQVLIFVAVVLLIIRRKRK